MIEALAPVGCLTHVLGSINYEENLITWIGTGIYLGRLRCDHPLNIVEGVKTRKCVYIPDLDLYCWEGDYILVCKSFIDKFLSLNGNIKTIKPLYTNNVKPINITDSNTISYLV